METFISSFQKRLIFQTHFITPSWVLVQFIAHVHYNIKNTLTFKAPCIYLPQFYYKMGPILKFWESFLQSARIIPKLEIIALQRASKFEKNGWKPQSVVIVKCKILVFVVVSFQTFRLLLVSSNIFILVCIAFF